MEYINKGDGEMEQEKKDILNILNKNLEPKSLDNLINRVKKLDDVLVLGIALLVSYGGKNDDVDFLSMVRR